MSYHSFERDKTTEGGSAFPRTLSVVDRAPEARYTIGAMRVCPACAHQVEAQLCPSDGTPTVPASRYRAGTEPLAGTVIGGRYRMLSLLGAGGMGTVWFAEHVTLRQPIAIKVMNPEVAADPVQRTRFEREALALSRMQHPNIVRIHDFGIEPDVGLYLAMEYLEGRDLASEIRKKGALPVSFVVHVARQVCRGLMAAHGRGVVHRDLKPGNIFLYESEGIRDIAKVLDFGIAKKVERLPDEESLTDTGLIVGSPHYMAPEQASGGPLGPAVDLYALGVILHESLCGRRPFTAEQAVHVIVKHLKEPPPPVGRADAPDRLVELVYALLAKMPHERPESAEAVLGILDELAREQPRVGGWSDVDTPLAGRAGEGAVARTRPSGGGAAAEPPEPGRGRLLTTRSMGSDTPSEEVPETEDLPEDIAPDTGRGTLQTGAIPRLTPSPWLLVAVLGITLVGGGLLAGVLLADRSPPETVEEAPAPSVSPATPAAMEPASQPAPQEVAPPPGAEAAAAAEVETEPEAEPAKARLTVRTTPPGATIALRPAGSKGPFEVMGKAPATLPLLPGAYVLRATYPGRRTLTERVELSEDMERALVLQRRSARPSRSSLPSPSAAPTPPPREPEPAIDPRMPE